MTAKKYLSQALWLDQLIENKIRYQEKLRTMAEKTTVDVSRERVSGGSSSNPREDIMVKLADLSHEVNSDIDKLIDLQKEIIDTINQVEDDCLKLILELRYVSAIGWDDIVAELEYERSWVTRLHAKALTQVDKILNSKSIKKQ